MKINEIDFKSYKTKMPTELDSLENHLESLEAELQQARYQERQLRGVESIDPTLVQAAQDRVYDLIQIRNALKDQISQKIATSPMQKAKSYMEQIERECSWILAINKKIKMFLLSGMKNRGAVIYGNTTTGRKPSQSDSLLTLYFDEYLSQTGCKALRSNSIFVTTDDYQAENYGGLYLIFPKNGFDYTFTNRKDLILNTDEHFDLSSLNKFVRDFTPQSSNIEEAMETGREIYLSGQYIALLGERFGVLAQERWGINYRRQHELLSYYNN